MKLIRLTDERWILDLGPGARADMVEMVRDAWEDWWKMNEDHLDERPLMFIVGGEAHPIEYEDRREPDIESRLRAIGERLDRLDQIHQNPTY